MPVSSVPREEEESRFKASLSYIIRHGLKREKEKSRGGSERSRQKEGRRRN